MIQALFPLPGGKGDRKYDAYLYPPLSATAIVEGFQGAACTSIKYHWLTPYLGEVDPAKRAIALALHNPQEYIEAYREARSRFWKGQETQIDRVFAFVGEEKAQTQLADSIPEIYSYLTQNWKAIASNLYRWMHGTADPRMAGYYAFCIRACFGNVMRTRPSGGAFNVTWHVEKLYQATAYSPEEWIDELMAIRWKPNVFGSWQESIAAVPDPKSTWCLLDPPYWTSGLTHKMTPAYCHHSIGTKGQHLETFNLAVDSLATALSRGFPAISVCNYYSPELDDAIKNLAQIANYFVHTSFTGECKALGNSNGRFKHGNRIDKRTRPVEVIYRIDRKKTQIFGLRSTAKEAKQLTLLPV